MAGTRLEPPLIPKTISVVVPTYRRPESLRRCLAALLPQLDETGEAVVVRRCEDELAGGIVADLHDERVREATVVEPGTTAAMAAGVKRSTGRVVALTDDDAIPRRDWIERLVTHFADPVIGGVGGRDIVHPPDGADCFVTDEVGLITRWGKLIGNHHVGAGPPREVMVLKGVNMAFRREALAVPSGLRGLGAQVHLEVAMCAWARARGWRLIYDPSLIVDHFPAERFDADWRDRPENEAVRNAAYNYCVALLTFDARLFWRRAAFGLLVGDRATPGVLRALLALVAREPAVARRLAPSLVGQAQGLLHVARGRQLDMVTSP